MLKNRGPKEMRMSVFPQKSLAFPILGGRGRGQFSLCEILKSSEVFFEFTLRRITDHFGDNQADRFAKWCKFDGDFDAGQSGT